MARERHGIEQVLYRVDWVRGLGFLAILVGLAAAAARSGGWQGWVFGAACFLIAVWVFGAACFLIAVGTGLWWWRHRDER